MFQDYGKTTTDVATIKLTKIRKKETDPPKSDNKWR